MRLVSFGLVFLFTFTLIAQPSEGLQEVNGTHLFVKIIGEGEPLLVIHGGPWHESLLFSSSL